MYGIIEAEDNVPNLRNKKSVLATVFTKELYTKLYSSRTSSGYTLDNAIQIGVDCEDHEIGFFLGDYECVEVFEPLLGRMLDKCQPFFDYNDGNVSHNGNLGLLKFDGTQTLKDFVIEYAFHLRRNLRGYSLPPHCTRAERREINRILIYILKQLQFNETFPNLKDAHKDYKNPKRRNSKKTPRKSSTNNNNKNDDEKKEDSKSTTTKSTAKKKKTKTKKNTKNKKDKKTKETTTTKETQSNGYAHTENKNNDDDDKQIDGKKSTIVDLVSIDNATLTELEEMGLAPSRESSLTAEYLIGGLSRDFPDARTFFYNRHALVGAWTNHENHLEIIMQHTEADLNYIYKKFVDTYIQFRKILKRKEMAWIRHRRLGIITTSPKHFGTGLTIRCSIRAPNLCKHPKFERILNKRSLELKNISEDIVDLETIHTLGRSELLIASDLGSALVDLCRMEKALSRNKQIDQLI